MTTTLETARQATNERIRERARGLELELERMPAFKRGTQFHVDRINELEFYRRQLARLEAK